MRPWLSRHCATGRVRTGGWSGRDEDAGTGEGADAHVTAVDLDGRRPIGGGGRDRAVAAREHLGFLEEFEDPGRELEFLRDAGHGEAVADTDVSGEDAPGEDVAAEPEVATPSPALRRAEVLKARRRLLSTLITLTVIASMISSVEPMRAAT